MDEAEKKKENDLPVNLVNMENVDNTKHNGLFDEAFISPNEEVQVRFVISGICKIVILQLNPLYTS